MTRRLPPEAAAEFLSLGYVLSREVAHMRIDAARKAGATEVECDEALATWEQMRADDVRVVHTQPTRCLCSHGQHGGLCRIAACGCGRYRPDTRRFMDQEKYDPSPYGIDRSVS